MGSSKELVVLLIHVELQGVLVVGEQGVVAVGEVGQRASQVEAVFNRGAVVHGSEVVLFDRQDHKLLEDLVAHQELFGRTRDVTVVVQDSHASETGDLHLDSDVAGQVSLDLGLFRGVHTGVKGSSRVVETLVPDLEYHI